MSRVKSFISGDIICIIPLSVISITVTFCDNIYQDMGGVTTIDSWNYLVTIEGLFLYYKVLPYSTIIINTLFVK